jgi:hypothetical protein
MSKDEWRKAWIDTLVEAGIFLDTAEDTFDVCYVNQNIDLTSDPVFAASAFIPAQVHGQMYRSKDEQAVELSRYDEKL